MKSIEIFTDGSCLGNPGAGGYGIILKYKQVVRELSAGYFITTNNRMEMQAAITALEVLKEHCQVNLYTDSQYLRNGVTKWLINWQANNWRTSANKPVKNIDLWQRLALLLKQQNISWHWVKAHAGQVENERCDELAKQAANHPNLRDEGYEISIANDD